MTHNKYRMMQQNVAFCFFIKTLISANIATRIDDRWKEMLAICRYQSRAGRCGRLDEKAGFSEKIKRLPIFSNFFIFTQFRDCTLQLHNVQYKENGHS